MADFTTPEQAVAWLRACGVQGLTTDSREVGQTDAFIAWPGAATDPRRFVASALAQGAAACVVELAGAEAYAWGAERVGAYANLKAGSGPIAAEFYGMPSRELAVMAVTGTNGKTSTSLVVGAGLEPGPRRSSTAVWRHWHPGITRRAHREAETAKAHRG